MPLCTTQPWLTSRRALLEKMVSKVAQRGPVMLRLAPSQQVEHLLFEVAENGYDLCWRGKFSANLWLLIVPRRAWLPSVELRVCELYQVLCRLQYSGTTVVAGGCTVDYLVAMMVACASRSLIVAIMLLFTQPVLSSFLFRTGFVWSLLSPLYSVPASYLFCVLQV